MIYIIKEKEKNDGVFNFFVFIIFKMYEIKIVNFQNMKFKVYV